PRFFSSARRLPGGSASAPIFLSCASSPAVPPSSSSPSPMGPAELPTAGGTRISAGARGRRSKGRRRQPFLPRRRAATPSPPPPPLLDLAGPNVRAGRGEGRRLRHRRPCPSPPTAAGVGPVPKQRGAAAARARRERVGGFFPVARASASPRPVAAGACGEGAPRRRRCCSGGPSSGSSGASPTLPPLAPSGLLAPVEIRCSARGGVPLLCLGRRPAREGAEGQAPLPSPLHGVAPLSPIGLERRRQGNRGARVLLFLWIERVAPPPRHLARARLSSPSPVRLLLVSPGGGGGTRPADDLLSFPSGNASLRARGCNGWRGPRTTWPVADSFLLRQEKRNGSHPLRSRMGCRPPLQHSNPLPGTGKCHRGR
ncbi:unnamed protein product, partial [Urochloa humidicola]